LRRSFVCIKTMVIVFQDLNRLRYNDIEGCRAQNKMDLNHYINNNTSPKLIECTGTKVAIKSKYPKSPE
jgi:hypothetical protein